MMKKSVYALQNHTWATTGCFVCACVCVISKDDHTVKVIVCVCVCV